MAANIKSGKKKNSSNPKKKVIEFPEERSFLFDECNNAFTYMPGCSSYLQAQQTALLSHSVNEHL